MERPSQGLIEQTWGRNPGTGIVPHTFPPAEQRSWPAEGQNSVGNVYPILIEKPGSTQDGVSLVCRSRRSRCAGGIFEEITGPSVLSPRDHDAENPSIPDHASHQPAHSARTRPAEWNPVKDRQRNRNRRYVRSRIDHEADSRQVAVTGSHAQSDFGARAVDLADHSLAELNSRPHASTTPMAESSAPQTEGESRIRSRCSSRRNDSHASPNSGLLNRPASTTTSPSALLR